MRRVAQAKCGNCSAHLEGGSDGQVTRVPCPSCGSTVRVIEVAVAHRVQLHESLAFKQKRQGYKKPIAEGISGDEFSYTLGKYVRKERLIDRLGNRYREEVTDPDTGQSIHSCNEPLDQHVGRGSAKPKP